jgi:hypothetical protein
VVWIENEQFPPSQASSKKEARKKAAHSALEHIFAGSSVTFGLSQPPTVSSDGDMVCITLPFISSKQSWQNVVVEPEFTSLNLDPRTQDVLESLSKHPISILSEYFQRQKQPLPTFTEELLPKGFVCRKRAFSKKCSRLGFSVALSAPMGSVWVVQQDRQRRTREPTPPCWL